MNAKLAIPPILALVIVAGWSGSDRYLISRLERENEELKAGLTIPSSGSEADASSSTTKTSGKSGQFKKLAALIAEVRRTDTKLAMLRLEQQCKGMTTEELVSMLDEIHGLDVLDNGSAQLKSMLVQQLCLKAPKSALERFAGLSHKDRDEMVHTLTSAMKEWSPQDLKMADTWFNGEITNGKFDGTAIDGQNPLRDSFESGLLGAWISVDPAAAAARLTALPENERGLAFWACTARPIKEEDQLTFANLVRTLAPEKSRTATLADLAASVSSKSAGGRVIGKISSDDFNDLPSDYTPVTEFLDRIKATPEERAATVEKCVLEKANSFLEGNLPVEKIETIRAWAMEQAPGLADKVTSALLWRKTSRGSSFSEMAEMATRYSEANGSDSLLIEFLSAKIPESSKGEARLLAEKITDSDRRQVVLDGMK